jgi:hypothetical protein
MMFIGYTYVLAISERRSQVPHIILHYLITDVLQFIQLCKFKCVKIAIILEMADLFKLIVKSLWEVIQWNLIIASPISKDNNQSIFRLFCLEITPDCS